MVRTGAEEKQASDAHVLPFLDRLLELYSGCGGCHNMAEDEWNTELETEELGRGLCLGDE